MNSNRKNSSLKIRAAQDQKLNKLVERGDIEGIKKLLLSSDFNMSLSIEAQKNIQAGDLDGLKKTFKYLPDNDEVNTAFIYACTYSQLSIMEYLFQFIKSYYQKNKIKGKFSPEAVLINTLYIMLLIKNDETVNGIIKIFTKSLPNKIEFLKVRIIRLLGGLDHDYDAERKFALVGCLTLDECLLGSLHDILHASLFAAIESKKIPVLDWMLQQKITKDFALAHFSYFINLIIKKGSAEALSLLIKMDIPLDQPDEKGLTPFLFACQKGRTDIIEKIVELTEGKCLQDKTPEGLDAVAVANKNKQKKVVRYLQTLQTPSMLQPKSENKVKVVPPPPAEKSFKEKQENWQEKLEYQKASAEKLLAEFSAIVHDASKLNQTNVNYKYAEPINRCAQIIRDQIKIYEDLIGELKIVKTETGLLHIQEKTPELAALPSQPRLREIADKFINATKIRISKNQKRKMRLCNESTTIPVPTLTKNTQSEENANTQSPKKNRVRHRKKKGEEPSRSKLRLEEYNRKYEEQEKQRRGRSEPTPYLDKLDDRDKPIDIYKKQKEEDLQQPVVKEKSTTNNFSNEKESQLSRMFSSEVIASFAPPNVNELRHSARQNLEKLLTVYDILWPNGSSYEADKKIIQDQEDILKCFLYSFMVCIFELTKHPSNAIRQSRNIIVHYLQYVELDTTLCFLRMLIDKCHAMSLVDEAGRSIKGIDQVRPEEFYEIMDIHLNNVNKDINLTLKESFSEEKEVEEALKAQTPGALLFCKLPKLKQNLIQLKEDRDNLLQLVNCSYLTKSVMVYIKNKTETDYAIASLYYGILSQIYMIGDGGEIDAMEQSIMKIITDEEMHQEARDFLKQLSLVRPARNIPSHNPTIAMPKTLAKVLNSVDNLLNLVTDYENKFSKSIKNETLVVLKRF